MHFQDDEAAFESYFEKEVPVVSQKQALVQQIKMVNIGCVCACAHVCGVCVCE